MTRPDDEYGAGTVLGERYEIVAQLGRGGMGTVYSAVELASGKRVALKCLSGSVVERTEHVDRFVQESLAAALVIHDNVVQALGAFAGDGGMPVMVMELLDGVSLDKLIDSEGPLAIGAAVDIAIQAAEGVAAAHAKGIVHRDLKPPNIFLVKREGAPLVKVLDFGTSRLRDPLSVRGRRRTERGSVLGTPEYTAPEQLLDPHAADERADVYSLGITLYEMLTGWPAFRAKSEAELIFRVLCTTPPNIEKYRPDVPDELRAVLIRATHAQPTARYATMREFADALRPFRDISERPPKVAPPAEDPLPDVAEIRRTTPPSRAAAMAATPLALAAAAGSEHALARISTRRALTTATLLLLVLFVAGIALRLLQTR